MSETARMIVRDPELFPLLTTDMKEVVIKAATNTVNTQAFLTRRGAQENIRSGFINRNTWTARSVQVTQMPHGRYSLSAIQASVGITEGASYMERQEFGGEHTPARGGTLSIPTNVARGGNKEKAVQKKFKLSELNRLKVRGEGRQLKNSSHKSRAVFRAAVAFREKLLVQYGGNLHFVEDFNTEGGRVSFRLRQVYSFDKPSTKTTARPWMRPAYEKVAEDGEKIFISNMKKLGL